MVAPADEKRSASLMKALTRQLLSFLIVGELVGFSSGALNAAEMHLPRDAARAGAPRTKRTYERIDTAGDGSVVGYSCVLDGWEWSGRERSV